MRILIAAAVLLISTSRALAAGSGEAKPPPPKAAPNVVTATMRYNEGEALSKNKLWKQAAGAYREAVKLKPEYPEAWNGLGHALKMQHDYPAALEAYQEALRLRPEFPQALEYLGEAYVAMGKTDEARATLEKLKPLDSDLAFRLERAIDAKGRDQGW